MQVEHRELYWFRLRVSYVQSEIGSLYCLAPESACSRGIQAGCERRLSPRSRLCEVDKVVLATLESVCDLALSSGVVSVSWMCALAPLL